MNGIEQVLMQPVPHAIGWALLQFVWQGAVIGLITAAALALLGRSAADIRYVVATIGLTVMLTMPIVNAVQTWQTLGATARPAPAAGPASVSRTTVDVVDSSQVERGSRVAPKPDLRAADRNAAPSPQSPWLPVILSAWLSGVLILTLRLAGGWLWVRRIRTRGTAPLADNIQHLAARLIRRLHIRRAVQFLESALVEVPTVVGWLKPVVLVPAGALAALTPAQLEAIIAHELAHIRRHDYLVNLLQTLVETLLFYHPAVWWLSRRIRIEREHCCDDLAVTLCGDPVVYARALADLEGLRSSGRIALAASGGSLLGRVRRLLGSHVHAGRGPGWLAGAAAVLLIAGIGAGAAGEGGPGSRMAAGQTAAVSSAPPRPVPVLATAAVAPAMAQPRGSRAPVPAPAPELARPVESAQQARAPEPVEVAAAPQPAVAPLLSVRPRPSAAPLAETSVALSSAVASVASAVQSTARQTGNFAWSDGRQKLEVNYSGEVEFTDDDTDVKSLTPGGFLRIRDGERTSGHTIEFRADASGRIERRYWSGATERPFEPDGRLWLAQALPRFIRQTGLGAASRVARILGSKGVDGVLAEIALIEGSWAKRTYFKELLKAEGLDERAIARIVERAGQEVRSDFELASLLIGSADRVLVSDATRRAYFDAARSLRSDFEKRRTYASALARGPVAPDLLAGVLDGSATIGSDFEAASLLVQIAKLQPLDARSRASFFKALDGVGSDFERKRTLSALVARDDLDAETLAAALESVARMGSDFEQATVLLEVLKQHDIDRAAREPFFRAAGALASAFERGRVLQAVAKRSHASPETLLAILTAVQGMKGSHESGQVLLAVAANHRLSGEARNLYIDIAERLGQYEQGRTLAALVKSERKLER